MNNATIEQLIVNISGYDDLQRRLLANEVERFRHSLEWVNANEGGRLLDIGARGDLVPVYRDTLGFASITCIDAAGCEESRTLQHESGRRYDFDAIRLNVERDPYPLADESIDQVVAMEVLEHLPTDPMFMLTEANRLLPAGGRLLLTTPNINSFSSVYQQLWGRHPAIGRQCFGPGILDRHHREYTPDEVRQVIEAAGFEIQRMDTFDVAPLHGSVARVRYLMQILRLIKPELDVIHRGSVIRCDCVKVSGVRERFPKIIYPRYPYYDYSAYDSELQTRCGARYWQTDVCSA